MNILDAIKEAMPLKKYQYMASTNGDEYAGPCPACGGEDRCRFWPNHPDTGHKGGSYWCRQCEESGDAIQLLKNHNGMSFAEACNFLEIDKPQSVRRGGLPIDKKQWSPKEENAANHLYQEQSGKFTAECHAGLTDKAKNYFFSRGLTEESLARYQVGWNPVPRYFDREKWGLEPEYDVFKYLGNEPGGIKPLYIPAGHVISNIVDGKVIGITIRRTGSKGSKYHHVTGGYCSPVILTDSLKTDLPVIVVETVLDAMLIDQEAGDLVVPIALNSAANKPDRRAHDLIESSPMVLVSHDFDQAGKKATQWWVKTYRHARPSPVPEGNDPGDYFAQGGDIRLWIQACLPEGMLIVADAGAIESVATPEALSGPERCEIGCRFGWCRHVNNDNGMYCEYAESMVCNLAACPLGKTIKENTNVRTS